MKGIRLVAGIVALVVAAAPAGAASAAAEFAAIPGQPLVSYDRRNGMIAVQQSMPLVRIYGDGLVRVYRPRYMRDPGEFAMRIDAAALQRLVASLDSLGVMRFDAEAVKRERTDIDVRRRAIERTEHVVSDPTTTTIALSFAAYRGASLERRVDWVNLGIDATRYPELPAIRDLSAAATALRAFVRHPDLEAVNAATPVAGAVR